ncbi:metal-binding protein ZinT [Paracoccus laeviglucosivorans]|uniref:Zinc transport system substrate-binding protein n=1 Tax=Paracoccus laeviglucosivorans TaxID=1197861 RepID=A0A521FGK3_9RHOB|nr:metal-binding protein ZinT [Paracoccus laeviglucosivorans]SMO95328.1 zinc transport system substrate-binding protein [Paracoccus laeviglucosivorans]
MMKTRIGAILLGGMILAAGQAMAHDSHSHDHGHDHGHDHAHAPVDKAVYDGYFEDAQVKDRPLSDYEGDWQSVYPLLQDGTLDPVMVHKAESGDKTAEEYRAYYETGYETDVHSIEIHGNEITFHDKQDEIRAEYKSDGHEILTYAKGNRGVRFIFRKSGGDDAAPRFIQFSDHGIAPGKAWHYHLYFGNDRDALLKEVTNWPTYYPAQMTGAQVAEEMIAH